MRIILLGAPGSGKGTQATLIEKEYGFPKISTGDLLRQAVADETPLGKRAEEEMKKGGLVRDEIVVELVRGRINKEDCRQGYVLDGFPRNILQAQRLEEMNSQQPEIVIEIRVPEEVLIARLSARRICPQCDSIYHLLSSKPKKKGVCDSCGAELIQREDDRPEVIRERLRVYHRETEPLINYYLEQEKLFRVDGSGEVKEVFKSISSVLKEERKSLGEKKKK